MRNATSRRPGALLVLLCGLLLAVASVGPSAAGAHQATSPARSGATRTAPTPT